MDAARKTTECPNCRLLERRVEELEAQVAASRGEVAKLTAALEEARRGGKRQAAPFRKAEGPQREPKRSGRRSGDEHGPHAHRVAPRPGRIDEHYEVPLPAHCPRCGGRHLEETHVDRQYHSEIPRQPIHREFAIHVGTCADCGHSVRGRHPLQTSDAVGAAASQLGPDAHAALALLNKQCGLSHGKCAVVFEKLFGLRIARGTSARSILRTAARCQPTSRAIREAVRCSEQVTPDETGWRVGGANAWLHVFATQHATCYAIDAARGYEVAAAVLGADYAGVLVHDGWAPYDRFTTARHQQCLAHVLRRCRELLETATRGAVRFPRAVQTLFGEVFRLREERAAGRLDADQLAESGLFLAEMLDELTAGRFTHDGNRRLAKHLRSHLWHWFWCLFEPEVDATNWRAEQAIRPAVVNRKVWGGNRTWAGAQAQAILMSVLRTCDQLGRDALTHLHHSLCNPRPPTLLPAGR
jgi:transposase